MHSSVTATKDKLIKRSQHSESMTSLTGPFKQRVSSGPRGRTSTGTNPRGLRTLVAGAQRRGVVLNSITAGLLAGTIALGGWTLLGKAGRKPGSDMYAFAASSTSAKVGEGQGKPKTSSLGYSLTMTKDELESALKELTAFQKSVTMDVSEPLRKPLERKTNKCGSERSGLK